MNVEDVIQIEIETTAIGTVLMDVPYTGNPKINDSLIISIPNRKFWGIDYTNLELIHLIDRDIELFKKLNERSDKNHQVYIDTLCLYGIKISGNHIRLQYWFHQDGNEDSHRMCAGVITYSCERGNYMHKKNEVTTLYPECYSQDTCVYW